MVMFAFGNALARAHKLYGVRIYTAHLTGCHYTQQICEHPVLPVSDPHLTTIIPLFVSLFLPLVVCVCQTQPRVLDHPVTVQAVGTNGRLFHFMVFQLNTTDLAGDDGIKNQVLL